MPIKKVATPSRSKDIIVSSVISIAITIVFGYYFLYIGIKERKPTFFVDPARTTILDKSEAAHAPLLLLKANGDTVRSDVTSGYFYFFNQGKETIRQENIYAPLVVSLGDGARILDYKILKEARAVSGIQLTLDSLSQTLGITFNALEQDDGVAVQLIYEGDKNTAIHLAGGIDGVKKFESRLITINPLYFVVALAIFLIAAYIYLVLSKRYPDKSLTLLFAFSAIPIIYLLLVFYRTEWFVTHAVPDTLLLQPANDLFTLPGWFK
ncbi:MAG: hypothetical protein JSU09_06845 [Bacteroidetes bacterium]|nr:hypothetical protein [Bacteroidota bacterium]